VLTAVGLVGDAYVHFTLAGMFDRNVAVISQRMLFRGQAALAVLAAVLVLVARRRAAAVLAVLVSASALAAVLVYRFIDVGALGVLPDMYEPVWYPEKALSAIAEGLATLAGITLLIFDQRSEKRLPAR
jgi:hypothetical protein